MKIAWRFLFGVLLGAGLGYALSLVVQPRAAARHSRAGQHEPAQATAATEPREPQPVG